MIFLPYRLKNGDHFCLHAHTRLFFIHADDVRHLLTGFYEHYTHYTGGFFLKGSVCCDYEGLPALV